jgi:hypothetical protein
MSDQKYFLITKEDAEVILNKSKRLTWDDANEVMAIIKDLKAVNFKGAEVSPFANKFSGTGDRNEKEVRDPLADAMVSGDVIWDETGNPI